MRHALVNVDALAAPSTTVRRLANIDAAFSLAWIDLTQGRSCSASRRMPDRFYTIQFIDAYADAFAYVGVGRPAPRPAIAVVPPGSTGTLPSGVQKIQAPTNTLGCSAHAGQLVFGAPRQGRPARYKLTPLAAFEGGARQGRVDLLQLPDRKPKSTRLEPTSSAPSTRPWRSIHAGRQPIACSRRSPPPASRRPRRARAPNCGRGEDIAGVTPAPADDPAVGCRADRRSEDLVAAAAGLQAALAARDHGWEILTCRIGTCATTTSTRPFATDFSAPTRPFRACRPTDATDVNGRP